MVNISSDVIRGYNDTIILYLLLDRPSYGYEISKQIKLISEEKYVIKETTLYSAFTRLEKNGYITSFSSSDNASGKLDIKQKNQLEDPQLTPDDFDEVVEAKSRLIDQLNNLDSGFEKLFERTKEELNGHKEDYKEQIRTMQEHIRSITDKSVKIQSQEARNKDLMTLKFASIKKQAREVRVGTQAASRYYKSMSGTGYMEPQFMDNKK